MRVWCSIRRAMAVALAFCIAVTASTGGAEAAKWKRKVTGTVAGYVLKKGVEKGLRSEAARGFAKRAVKKGVEKVVATGMKGILKRYGLPTTGRVRFVPPKNAKGLGDLLVRQGRSKAKVFKDRFGNEWTQGPSRTKGETFEWDVVLSPAGRERLGWALGKSREHLNVSQKGRVTH